MYRAAGHTGEPPPPNSFHTAKGAPGYLLLSQQSVLIENEQQICHSVHILYIVSTWEYSRP